MASRLYYYKEKLLTSAGQDDGISPVPAPFEKANLISSLCDDGLHKPALDIDYDAELVPSSTPGHFHLYLNKSCNWNQYKAVLKALSDAGLIQSGFSTMSIARAASYLRKPGILKDNPDPQF